MGHLWHYGWSIVDVTDPRNPKFVKTVPGPGNTWTIQMTLHDNIMVTALEKSSLAWGADPNKPNEEGVLIWDISDPINPRQLSHWKTGANGTHRNSYPGGKYVYLSARTGRPTAARPCDPDGGRARRHARLYPSFARPKIEKVRQPAPRAWLVRDAVR